MDSVLTWTLQCLEQDLVLNKWCKVLFFCPGLFEVAALTQGEMSVSTLTSSFKQSSYTKNKIKETCLPSKRWMQVHIQSTTMCRTPKGIFHFFSLSRRLRLGSKANCGTWKTEVIFSAAPCRTGRKLRRCSTQASKTLKTRSFSSTRWGNNSARGQLEMCQSEHDAMQPTFEMKCLLLRR